jgi:hypothetical protein
MAEKRVTFELTNEQVASLEEYIVLQRGRWASVDAYLDHCFETIVGGALGHCPPASVKAKMEQARALDSEAAAGLKVKRVKD